jgi:RHS repeat-associated protein
MVAKQFSRRGAEAQSWEIEKTSTLIWDGYNIIQSLTHTQTHTLTNSFIWGLDLSGSLQGFGGVGGLLAEVHDGAPYFAAFDANGNVTEYLSTNVTIAAHYEYSPFGEIVVQSGNLSDSFTHRFSAKPWCAVTGLSEYELRKYGPGMRRWLSRDPIKEFAGLNRYSYLANNPLGAFDYLGLIDPEKTVEVFNTLLACKASHPKAYNWDAAIEYLLKKAYGKKWKKKLVQCADAISKGLGTTTYIPAKYEDANDVLEKLYPEGVPFETKGLLDADLSKIVSGIGKVQSAIDAVALLTEGSEDLTGADAVNLLSRVFDFSKSLGGSAPGIGSFLTYYSAAIKAAAEGIKNIEDNLFNEEADIMMQFECPCITELSSGYHGVIKDLMKQLNKVE